MSGVPMKTLSERIASTRTKTAYAPHANRAIVIALRTDIQGALNDGWSVLAIYKTLYEEGRLTFSYQAFRRHVNRLLLGKCQIEKRGPALSKGRTSTLPPKPLSGFSFNASINKEDLL